MLGFWMWADELNRRNADAVFDDVSRAGATDVYFLSKGLSGRCAFLTERAPSVSEGRDLLNEAIDAAHARGIRLHAWLTSAQDENYCASHPGSGLFHYSKGASDKIVSIADASYAEYMRSIVQDVLEKYPIDGVHLDYIRYNHLLYGWSEADLKRYEEHGVSIARARELLQRTFYGEKADSQAVFDAFRSGDETVRALAAARIDDVCRFADALLGGVTESRRDVVLSAALMPEGAYDTAFAHLHYGQSYQELSKRFDVILPMAYSAAYGMDAEWVRRVSAGALKHGARVVAGLHAYDGATGLTLKKDMDAALGANKISGVCLFRYGTSLMAAVQGKTLQLINPTDTPITQVELSDGEKPVVLQTFIAAGESSAIHLSFEPVLLRAWSGKKEVCAFLAKRRRH